MTNKTLVLLQFTAIAGFLNYMFGDFNTLLQAFVFFVVADYITGIVKAFINKKLASDICIKGVVKKFFMFCVVAMSFVLQKIVNIPLRDITILFFIGGEGISILENGAEIGIKYPKKLLSILGKLRDDNG